MLKIKENENTILRKLVLIFCWKVLKLGCTPHFLKLVYHYINILWWYKFSFYGGLCSICFFSELGSSGSIFVP
jgi:hypothetical protein